ncbi:MAG: TIGR00730 family Rossman fold protein [Patescibacteria group bacterium]
MPKIKKLSHDEQHRQAIQRGEIISPEELKETAGVITWRIFRILSEFVDGYEFLSGLKNNVTVFGSARLKPGEKHYNEAYKLGKLLARAGYGVVTGGGPGIMEAANKGAYEAGGESLGLNIKLPMEQRVNPYVRHSIGFHFFFTRKVMLTSPAKAFFAFPGGFGSMDEVFEIMTLMQTGKINPVPVILVGKRFWGSLDHFIVEHMLKEKETISKSDTKIYKIVDTAEEAMKALKSWKKPKQKK